MVLEGDELHGPSGLGGTIKPCPLLHQVQTSPQANRSWSTNFLTLPMGVMGSSSTNTHRLGTL